MLRLLLKIALIAWFGLVVLLLAMLNIGKIAPDRSEVAFFSQDVNGTTFWRLDLFTGLSFKDSYSPQILVNSIDSVAFNPLSHFLTLEPTASELAIYELNLISRERRYIGSYPISNHYIALEGDFVFIVDFTGGTYDWIRIDIPSLRRDLFLEDTEFDNLELSPDETWLAGLNRNKHLFINMLDGLRYTLSGYCCIFWSPDSQWYIAAHDNSAGLISVLSARGEAHPVLPESFSAPAPFWARDSQSIFFIQGNHLAAISLQTAEVREYPITAQDFQTHCLAPNERFIIIYNENDLALVDIETGTELWRMKHDSARVRACLWSEDNRYLTMYLSAQAANSSGISSVNWQTFVFLDTLTGNHWNLYPENLPVLPFYIHIPD